MELTDRIFTKINTFHGISPAHSLDEQCTKFEKHIILVRAYAEVCPQSPKPQ